MRAENDTNDPVEYDQSGAGGDGGDEKPDETPPGSPNGRVDPGHTSQPWVPRGRPPWSVQFTDTKTNRKCTVGGITNPNATVTIASFNPCDGSHA